MPMHDWTRVKSGIYHNFHYRWIAAIMDRLNAGLLPSGYFAMAEQIIGRPETDVVALQTGSRRKPRTNSNGGVADKPLTLAAYQVEPIETSYVEPIAVGDPLPEMPLFLFDEYGISVPLEETYQTTWNVLPAEIRQLLEPPT